MKTLDEALDLVVNRDAHALHDTGGRIAPIAHEAKDNHKIHIMLAAFTNEVTISNDPVITAEVLFAMFINGLVVGIAMERSETGGVLLG